MKTLRSKSGSMLCGFGLVGALSLTAFSARADLEVSASVGVHATADFYAPLSADGAWVEVGSYGRCWRPAGITAEWRPYCSGNWVWTDCGWYWASDEPWAWACYHYGWWSCDPTYGWVWVPGVEWAPAWVTWRVGGGYIGWAPLAPHGVRISGPQFVFVQEARFSEPLRPGLVVANNTTIFGKTTVVNNVKRETRSFGGGAGGKVVINEGPGLGAIEKASGRKVRQVPIQEAARQAAAPARMSPGARGVVPSESPRGESFARPAPTGKPSEPSEGKGHNHEHEREHNDHGKDHS
ncbi:MAG TPA: DUF6600 domain-containing protein [Candidatus Acidoferrum sp.]|jgi:hypothetical protein|nr:DUF6600 domain-containing protein [Candidatus Acidoferrum sp.]